MPDLLEKMWEAQANQQRDLGLDPRHMNEVDRRAISGDLALSLYEEVAELQRATSHYKRHILTVNGFHRDNVAEEVADVLKLVFAVAQLHGLSPGEVADAFHRKTNVVASRAEAQRVSLKSNTKVLCVDMDDVLADLSPWTRELKRLQGGAPQNARTLQMMESWKDDWYNSGRFRELKPVEGAAEALRTVIDWGYKVVVITARPQWQYKRIYADTLEWLQAHDMPHHLILFGKDKVELIYQHIVPAWPVAFVEDHERNARHLSAAGVNVLLFDTPRNQGVGALEGVKRVAGWKAVLEQISNLSVEERCL